MGELRELVPVAMGLAAGLVLLLLRPSTRIPAGGALPLLLGVLTTVITGEFRMSWAFALVDIPLVAVSAAAGAFLGRGLSMRLGPEGVGGEG